MARESCVTPITAMVPHPKPATSLPFTNKIERLDDPTTPVLSAATNFQQPKPKLGDYPMPYNVKRIYGLS